MTKFLEFSYPIDAETTVLEAGFKPPTVVVRSRISEGRHSNTSYIELFAHTGTHIDAPWHFIDDGYRIDDLATDDFIFDRVLFLEISTKRWSPIPVAVFRHHEEALKQCDCLLIYSGFSANRIDDPESYVEATPGLSLEAAEYLGRFDNLGCIGVDFISIENVYEGRKTGFPVHHALLDRTVPMILLEDANLAILQGKSIARIFLFPLRMKEIEASPVTAVAEIKH